MLAEADLSGGLFGDVQLVNSNLKKAWFSNSNLSDANLIESDFTEATMIGTNFNGAFLAGSKFDRADLIGSKMMGAEFYDVSFKAANLKRVDLTNAEVDNLNLTEAKLDGVIFDYVDAGRIQFSLSSLRFAQLENSSNLKQEQLDAAFGVRQGVGLTHLPKDLAYPNHWYDAEQTDEDTYELEESYQNAYLDWLKTQAEA